MVRISTFNDINNFTFHNGFGYKILDINTSINYRDPRIFYGLVPDSEKTYNNNKGKECMFLAYSDKDFTTYSNDKSYGETFQAIILNKVYEIQWGSLVDLETRGKYMPIMPYD